MSTNFAIREILNQNKYKDSHREEVIDFFNRWHDVYQSDGKWSMLCLPLAWRTERMILDRGIDATFVGVERDRDAFYRVAYSAPGSDVQVISPSKIVTTRSTILKGDLAKIISGRKLDGCTISCAWLDTCSQLTERLVDAMSDLPKYFPKVRRVPVALTVIKGRENTGMLKKLRMSKMNRAACVAASVSGDWAARVVKVVDYNSDNNCPMQLIFLEYINLNLCTVAQRAAFKAARTRRNQG